MDKETLYRYVSCRLSPEEETRVLDWLEADPEHERELSRIQQEHDLAALSAPLLNALYEQDHSRSRRALRFVRRWGMGAAAAVLLAVAGYYYQVAHRYTRQAAAPIAVVVPNGQHIDLTLQDGTRVWLNAGTRLEYPVLFDNAERRVKLTGEARFEVRHDAAHPFVVETFACDVRVLGTEFNIVADAQDNLFSTALFKGRVQVSSRLVTGEQIILEPNEQVRLRGKHLTIEQIDNPDNYRWTEGIVNLSGLGFAELMGRFEKAFGIEIILERVPDIHIDEGKIRTSAGIDKALEALQRFADFRYTHDPLNNTITIR